MTDLERRVLTFSRMVSRFSHQKIHDLIVVYEIPPNDLELLRWSTLLYMSRGPDHNILLTKEKDLVSYYNNNYDQIKNITFNGMIVPKQHSMLEYNLLNRAFYQIIKRLNIDDFITSWHVPLNLRIKLGQPRQDNLVRNHPTEHIHSDSLAGESSYSITTMIPIFGDVKKNYVKFYTPPTDFEESWLGPKPSYKDAADIAKRYKPINFVAGKNQLVLSDFATMHASSRKKNAGSRISIDTTFALKRDMDDEIIHPWRENERAVPEIVNNVGSKYMFVFPDKLEQKVDSQGGFKHPTNLYVKELF